MLHKSKSLGFLQGGFRVLAEMSADLIETVASITHLDGTHIDVRASRYGTDPLNTTVLAEAQTLPTAGGAMPMADRLVRAILESLDDAKAEEIVSIDLQGKTSIADTMVVASGRSSTHVGAIADRLIRSCKDLGLTLRVEGLQNCDWVLIDAGDAIVHVFRPEVRQFYNLEKMWGGNRPEERRVG